MHDRSPSPSGNFQAMFMSIYPIVFMFYDTALTGPQGSALAVIQESNQLKNGALQIKCRPGTGI
jgi:hypothetical protein